MPLVTTQDEPARLIAAVTHKGAYSGISAAMQRAGEQLQASGRTRDVAEMVAIYHDNPAHVAEENLRSHAGFALKSGRHVPEGFEALHLEEGRYAICTHFGAYKDLPKTWDWLLNTWIPDHQEVAEASSMFEVYVNSPETTPEDKLVTKIYVLLDDEDFNGPL